MWDAIEDVVSRAELRAAVASLSQVLPPPDADPDGEWRAKLVERLAAVRGFVPLLCRSIDFGATAEAAPVLAAVAALPELLQARTSRQVPAGWLDARRVATELVPAGWWQRLVFPANRPGGAVAKAAYAFCMLEQFHRHLGRRNIFARAMINRIRTYITHWNTNPEPFGWTATADEILAEALTAALGIQEAPSPAAARARETW
ncbi:MAG TPA: hypothetical protein VIC62_25055 [Nakamurella sp.]